MAGTLVGPGFLGLIEVSPAGRPASRLADLALFTVLFVDGGRLPVRELRAGWRLSGRALVLGMLSLLLSATSRSSSRSGGPGCRAASSTPAAWFGPKGFAAVVYGLLAAQSGIADPETVSSSPRWRSPCRSWPTP